MSALTSARWRRRWASTFAQARHRPGGALEVHLALLHRCQTTLIGPICRCSTPARPQKRCASQPGAPRAALGGCCRSAADASRAMETRSIALAGVGLQMRSARCAAAVAVAPQDAISPPMPHDTCACGAQTHSAPSASYRGAYNITATTSGCRRAAQRQKCPSVRSRNEPQTHVRAACAALTSSTSAHAARGDRSVYRARLRQCPVGNAAHAAQVGQPRRDSGLRWRATRSQSCPRCACAS